MRRAADQERVTLGVPVYRGEPYLAETLRSIQRQTHRAFEVLISLDGPQPQAEEICRPFLRDSRFRLATQPQRLGWVRNLGWLMARVETPYWCYQAQDDLLDRRYLEVLLEDAQRVPEAAVVYSDIVAFGTLSAKLVQESVTGSAVARQLALLTDHLAAVAFRGLTRVEALRLAGGIPANAVDSFGCDTAWMAAVARWGELRRVPVELYRKRYHAGNEHGQWTRWPAEKRVRAWAAHCAAMCGQALRVEATAPERRLLFLAAASRLIAGRAADAYPLAELTPAQRASLLDAFLEQVRALEGLDVPGLLAAGWEEIRSWTEGLYEVREAVSSPAPPPGAGAPFAR